MNRSEYFDFIEAKLSLLATRIELRGRLNLLDLNLHSENFYRDFFNVLFGWKLENLNIIQPNAAGIDLIDRTNKILIQVSASTIRKKVESALAKAPSTCKGYFFKFISISKDAKNLRKKVFPNPNNLIFSPNDDIYDISSLLKHICGMEISEQRKIYDFIKGELRNEPDPEKVDSNLTHIINILSREDWSKGEMFVVTRAYDIEAKISYNQLDSARVLIDNYKIHYSRIEKIYADFDKQGANKSLSILNGIRTEYLNFDPSTSPDHLFYSIINKVAKKIRESANYTPLPDEELILCVQILVVDAFIRCKIFKNPVGYANARS